MTALCHVLNMINGTVWNADRSTLPVCDLQRGVKCERGQQEAQLCTVCKPPRKCRHS